MQSQNKSWEEPKVNEQTGRLNYFYDYFAACSAHPARDFQTQVRKNEYPLSHGRVHPRLPACLPHIGLQYLVLIGCWDLINVFVKQRATGGSRRHVSIRKREPGKL